MRYVSAEEFSRFVCITPQAVRLAFRNAAMGKKWRGETLPVTQVPDQSGGKGGKVWALHVDGCSPKLRAMLGLPDGTDLTVVKAPIETPVKAPVDDLQIQVALDRQRILAPILQHPKRSAERATAIRQAAEKVERYGDEWRKISESTLRGWVTSVEADGAAALLPTKRSDKGKARHQITRAWEKGCGLSTEKQAEIATALARTASGLIAKGRSSRTTVRLCVKELQGLTAEAGAKLSKTELTVICKLNSHWVKRFAAMKAVNLHDRDHKAFSDTHEFKVARGLTAMPMEVLYGDCHQVDIMVADALKSTNAKVRAAGKEAEKQGLTRIRLTIIGWLEGSSHYLWATPVLLGPGQGITQQDVARSLWEVLRCPHGGIPQTIVIDNGGEFGALAEAVMRFCVMAQMSGLGTVTCKPYSPESKGRLEGAFGILEKTFLSALDGYIAGDRMKSPTKSKGKPRDPYRKGAVNLIADVNLAVQQYCGWPQDGDLEGLSPKAMLESKIAATGWRAQVPTEDVFDLVFSHEERRDVRKGAVSINGRAYSGPVLAKLIGEKQVSFLVPMRDPDGPVLHFREGTIYRLHAETYGQMDREGAKAKGEMVRLQKAEINARRATADMDVDVQAMISATADLTPVAANPPDTWQMGTLDKGGFLTAPRTEAEALAAEDAAARQHSEEIQAFMMEAGRREASGGNR